VFAEFLLPTRIIEQQQKNLFLTEAGLTRIIIPTVYRDDYISALEANLLRALTFGPAVGY
jgi:hypothetical protein